MTPEDRRMLEAHETLEERRRHVESIADEFFAGFEAVDRLDRPAVSAPSPTTRRARQAVGSATPAGPS